MRRWVIAFAVLVGIGILGAVAVIYSGAYNVAASSGHWAVTRYVLHTAMERSVKLRAGKGSPEGFDDAAHIRLAAAHFSHVCARCHAAPGLRPQALGEAITPEAPDFRHLTDEFTDGEVFWIVRHGIKMTGMPAWPSPVRSDEIWSMVAFLKAAPQMSNEEFERMAYGSFTGYPGDPVMDVCAQCHGSNGNGRDMANMPVLAGQKAGYLGLSLDNFRAGKRASGIMQVMASQLSDDDIRRISDYFAKAPRSGPRAPAADPVLAARGQRLAFNGDQSRDIPICKSCHGPSPRKEDPMVPDIRGQRPQYIVEQLQLFKADTRGRNKYAQMMHEAAQSLTPDEMKALAAYYSSLAINGGGS